VEPPPRRPRTGAWLEVDFSGSATINEVDVFSVQDNYASPSTPTPTMTFTQYGLTDFQVQYWTGTAWTTVPNGAISGNNLVWRQITFPALTTSKIRIYVTGALNTWSRITEVEAYTAPGSDLPPTVSLTSPTSGASFAAPASFSVTATAADADGSVTRVDFYANGSAIGTAFTAPYTINWANVAAGSYSLTAVATDNAGLTTTSAAVNITVTSSTRMNVALAANGGTATASSTYSSGYAPAGAINGDRLGLNWGAGGGWNDATPNVWPDWLELDFSGSQTINEVDVFSVQDNYASPSTPTPTMTFTQYGLTDFQVQYWTGTAWATVPNGAISSNNLVWQQIAFPALTTSKIRIYVTGALNTWSRITEVEAYTP
jgi:hypothetical protein